MNLLSKNSSGLTSDQSRGAAKGSGFRPNSPWLAPLVGLAFGVLYAAMEWWLDRFSSGVPRHLVILHDAFDWLLPVFIGVMGGYGFHLSRRLVQLNRVLSTHNHYLKSRLLTNTLLAHILHEIRNPVHNLSAALDRPDLGIPKDDFAIIQRNLERLNATTEQLKRMTLLDPINPNQTVPFPAWLHEYLARSVTPAIRNRRIRYEEYLEPVLVHMHPLLLEQAFTILFQNALQAVEKSRSRPSLRLTARFDPTRRGFVRVRLSNNGSPFPEEVILAHGKRTVKSSEGLGLGLVLLRDTLEIVGGSLELSNEDQQALVVLLIPGEPLR